ncbi:O-acetyl-ADP-ribose deacetylase (regulator of RNase III) [Sagittula marina]|uniref:O-acetyl-ADP-ribose deacetylase (Regulator of RNase III) n=1 Tax=Sagittula marina TaxID=943940 RepID=A0A7W6DSI5_9RHOB|nr:macro domain-containing protein [Sagittula marina]MBB3988014.1 O-acetyl-ADP-ribose deacetylase (regulator of RNase III) [Sagittula marina]
MLEFVKGDMFDVHADVRVNTVNCVGVMGAGVALAFKQRYPDMFKQYQRDCRDDRVKPGAMNVWKSLTGDWVINFPTKRHWRNSSRYEDIDAGLEDLRSYLDSVGPVTVTLPALGCGHGGLDWARVSRMIREKLDGVNAHVLIFEPSASRHVGHEANAQPTEDERVSAEQLGYDMIQRETLPTFDVPGQLYLQGSRENFFRPWIALLPSRKPGERELQALQAIASELMRVATEKSVAIIYNSRASEEVASLFLNEGIDVVFLLPFGILTRKTLAKSIPRQEISGSLSIASAAPANGKWSRQLYAQTMDLLRQNAEAVLSSDPEPEWLSEKGLSTWGERRVCFIRYETMPLGMRNALEASGARPIGRRAEDGAPNIDFLIGRERTSILENSDSSIAEVQSKEVVAAATDDESQPNQNTLTISLSDASEVVRREVFDAVMSTLIDQITLTITLPHTVKEEDRRQLLYLGFKEKK